jgi:hypothetical protein
MDTKYSHNLAAIERHSDAIIAAIRPHHRHSNDDAIADVLRIEFEDMTADTLAALAAALIAYKRAALGAQYGMDAQTSNKP